MRIVKDMGDYELRCVTFQRVKCLLKAISKSPNYGAQSL